MILATLDTSETSERALDVAVAHAVAFDEPLSLLLVIDGPLRHHLDEIARGSASSLEAVADGYLADLAVRLRERTSGLAVLTSAVHGTDAGPTIVEQADGADVRLVVMASHGRSGLSRLIVGSVTSYVLQHITRPVLVVPRADRAAIG